MDTLKHIWNKHLGKVVAIRLKDGQEKSIRILQVDFITYKVYGYDSEGMNQYIDMKDIIWVKKENSSRREANEESSKQHKD